MIRVLLLLFLLFKVNLISAQSCGGGGGSCSSCAETVQTPIPGDLWLRPHAPSNIANGNLRISIPLGNLPFSLIVNSRELATFAKILAESCDFPVKEWGFGLGISPSWAIDTNYNESFNDLLLYYNANLSAANLFSEGKLRLENGIKRFYFPITRYYSHKSTRLGNGDVLISRDGSTEAIFGFDMHAKKFIGSPDFISYNRVVVGNSDYELTHNHKRGTNYSDRVEESLGKVLEFVEDKNDGRTFRFEYNPDRLGHNRVFRITDYAGEQYVFSYTTSPRRCNSWDDLYATGNDIAPNSNNPDVRKNEVALLNSVTFPNGQKIKLTWSSGRSYQITKIEYPDNTSFQACYNQDGVTKWVKDELNNLVQFNYTSNSVEASYSYGSNPVYATYKEEFDTSGPYNNEFKEQLVKVTSKQGNEILSSLEYQYQPIGDPQYGIKRPNLVKLNGSDHVIYDQYWTNDINSRNRFLVKQERRRAATGEWYTINYGDPGLNVEEAFDHKFLPKKIITKMNGQNNSIEENYSYDWHGRVESLVLKNVAKNESDSYEFAYLNDGSQYITKYNGQNYLQITQTGDFVKKITYPDGRITDYARQGWKVNNIKDELGRIQAKYVSYNDQRLPTKIELPLENIAYEMTWGVGGTLDQIKKTSLSDGSLIEKLDYNRIYDSNVLKYLKEVNIVFGSSNEVLATQKIKYNNLGDRESVTVTVPPVNINRVERGLDQAWQKPASPIPEDRRPPSPN